MSISVTKSRPTLAFAYSIEGLSSISANLLLNGVAFYMTQRFHWSATQNLLMAMMQGLCYAIGALLAGGVARRLGKTGALIGVHTGIVAIVALLQFAQTAWVCVPLLLAFTIVSALNWPLIESTVTQGCSAHQMSRRITIYNLTWSGTAVLTIAVYGTILANWQNGTLVIPLVLQSICLILALLLHRRKSAMPDTPAVAPAVAPEPELLHCRRLALWLSRICMPASFIVANSLMALFASLPASVEMGVKLATFVASLWMAGRVLAFVVLGLGTWWHTRPRLLLGAGVMMLFSFLLIVVPAERFGIFANLPLASVIGIIAIAELLLGLAAGMIFSGSLYFGMVLSEGSTDHGGYHEALIGLGGVAGPGLAAVAQTMGSGSDWPGIATVAGLMLVTLLIAGGVTIRLRAPEPTP